MRITGLLESSVYVDDIARSACFYRELFAFDTLVADERMCALAVAGRQVLLLFKKGGTAEPIEAPGGVIPPHDGRGTTHLAFSAPAEDLHAWERRLAGKGIAIESRVRWERGGQSIYFRDPDGHLLELATPGVWAIY